MGITTHNFNSSKVTQNLISEMEQLRAEQNGFNSPFFAPDFFRLIGEVRDDVNVFIGEDAEGLAYFWPMHLSLLGEGRGIGGPFSDRNGPVKRQDYHLDIPGFLATESINSFRTSGFSHTDLSNSKKLAVVQTNETDLTGGTDNFFETQRQNYPSHYKTLRRLARKIERDFSEVEFRFDDRTPETFRNLKALKQAQFKASGRHDVLGPKWVADMFDRLNALDEDKLRTRMSSLYLDGVFAAAELNLQSHNVLHGWIVAYDHAFSKYSPGSLLTQYILQNLESNGIQYYDSGIEGDHYKKYVSNRNLLVGTGVIDASYTHLTPRQFCGRAWKKVEMTAPERLASILKRTRRRSDQILATEVGILSRAKGFLSALNTEI